MSFSPSHIAYDEFARVDIRSGTILSAEAFVRARNPSYKIRVDFGPEIGVLQTSAQVTMHYSCESLIGKKILGCVNMGEKNIAGFTSQFLLLGFSAKEGGIILAGTDSHVPDGQKLH